MQVVIEGLLKEKLLPIFLPKSGERGAITPLLLPSSDGPFVCTALKFVALDDMRRMKEPNLSTIGRQNKFPVKSFTRCTIYNLVINHNYPQVKKKAPKFDSKA